jgi:ElaB/YqjD/DUF883 family membrane-anchored ribosome-binding protein
MEITLEKIELVKDRTGVTYKEAKEALEKTEGNVVEAIILIEDNVDDQASTRRISAKGEALIDKIKETVKRGNVARIIVKKDGETFLNMPLNAGVLGAVVAPWGIVVGAVAAFGFKCEIELLKDDGEVVSLTDKAGNLYEDAVTKGTGIYEDLKSKAPDAFEDLKTRGGDAVETLGAKVEELKNKADEAIKKVQEKAEEIEEAVEEAMNEAEEEACEEAEEACEAAEDAAEEACEAAEGAVEEACEAAEEACEEAAEKLEE